MASLVDALSMFRLEDELTCSICLCVFQTPVTTPCGHNFCLPCLEMTWMEIEENFSCPQCRASFEIRPDLKKNTVLCKVVEQFQISQDAPSKETREEKQEKADSSVAKPRAPSPVACDSCLVVEAAKTCLTCMASFCQEHLRPHLESPAFKTHQLSPPVKELQQKKCQTHNKLLEVFCQDHRVSICCFCLVSHKTCSTCLLQEAKETKKLQLKKRLAELCALSDKTAKSLEQVRAQQKQLSNTTSRKLELLKSEFLEIVALIHEEEKDSWKTIKAEEKRVLDKFEYVHTVLGKKKNEIQRERDEIEMTLTEMDDITFLKKSTKLREVSFTDVFVPRIELDQNLLGTVYQKAFNLKEITKRFLGVPLEQKKKGGALVEGATCQAPGLDTNWWETGKEQSAASQRPCPDQFGVGEAATHRPTPEDQLGVGEAATHRPTPEDQLGVGEAATHRPTPEDQLGVGEAATHRPTPEDQLGVGEAATHRPTPEDQLGVGEAATHRPTPEDQLGVSEAATNRPTPKDQLGVSEVAMHRSYFPPYRRMWRKTQMPAGRQGLASRMPKGPPLASATSLSHRVPGESRKPAGHQASQPAAGGTASHRGHLSLSSGAGGNSRKPAGQRKQPAGRRGRSYLATAAPPVFPAVRGGRRLPRGATSK